MLEDIKDVEIVRRTLQDKESFALLIEKYEPKLLRYLSRLGVSIVEDREDILQNAFIKAYKNLNSFDQTLEFSSWMYRITHNEAMSFFRYKKARPAVVLSEDGQNLLTEMRDDSSDTTSFTEARLSNEELSNALSKIDSKYRTALILRFFEGRSYAEISDILELPLGTVSTLIHRAKKELRDKMFNKYII